MPEKCYNKPNRSKPRFFKMCDAARIAREVVRDNPGDTPEEVLACIAKGLGFTHISLSRPRTVGGSLIPVPPTGVIIIIVSVLARLAALAKRYGPIAKFINDVIDSLSKAKDLIEKISATPDQAKVDDVIGEGKCNCKKEEKILLTQSK